MVRLGNVGCLPVHAVFHLSQVRQMGGRILTIPPQLTILGRGYAMNIPVITVELKNWNLEPLAVWSARGGNVTEFGKCMDPSNSHSGKSPCATSFALKSGQSINTRCFPDGPTGRLCPFSRFVLAPWRSLGPLGRFPTGGASHDSFPTGGFYPPPLPPTVLGMVDITRKVPRMGNMPYGVGTIG